MYDNDDDFKVKIYLKNTFPPRDFSKPWASRVSPTTGMRSISKIKRKVFVIYPV